MKIEDKLTASVIQGVKELYGAEVPAKMVQLQKTKKNSKVILLSLCSHS